MLQNQSLIEKGDTKISAELSIGKDANPCKEIEDGVLVADIRDDETRWERGDCIQYSVINIGLI